VICEKKVLLFIGTANNKLDKFTFINLNEGALSHTSEGIKVNTEFIYRLCGGDLFV
jgi:hypothetical protein